MLKYPVTKGDNLFNHHKPQSLKTAELPMHLVVFMFMYITSFYYKS